MEKAISMAYVSERSEMLGVTKKDDASVQPSSVPSGNAFADHDVVGRSETMDRLERKRLILLRGRIDRCTHSIDQTF